MYVNPVDARICFRSQDEARFWREVIRARVRAYDFERNHEEAWGILYVLNLFCFLIVDTFLYSYAPGVTVSATGGGVIIPVRGSFAT